MGTPHRLEGENAESALQLLETVTEIFEQCSIKYCLTAGTLLGIVREERLLPWDTDLDLRIFRPDVKKLPRAMWRIRFAGYLARIRRQEFIDPPLKKGEKRIVKIFQKAGFLKKGKVTMDCFIATRQDNDYVWSCGGPKLYTKKSVPAHFYDETKVITFRNKDYTVPKDVEDYLTFRYGDWRTPVKEWDYTKDDGAIISPELNN
ncbi:MAG: LicD family protein [Candidatus Marinimicrobia bacterium]|mgnify:FL=1|nr:LicD family protein [Candidatus Neomarinimicrobiota bacterium]MDP7060276.1 LicD family protein [Candidatus Neomarinimicrobiota bacterium]